MTLIEKINADYMTAYKKRDMLKKNFLGVIKGEVQIMQGRGIEVNDTSVMDVLKRMEKSLNLTNSEESLRELDYIKPYMPVKMSEDDIREIINEYKKNGMTSIGDIMREFNSHFKGLADNSIVSRIAKKV